MDTPKIIVMWRGDRQSPETPTRYGERLSQVMDALRVADMAPEPLIYFDARAEDARTQLRGAAGVLVWINPVADGEDRRTVDSLLREAAQAGAFVSAHPDVIAKMGVKGALYTTRTLSWALDTKQYLDAQAFASQFPEKVAAGPRVLKPHRGNDGRDVLKVTCIGDEYFVQHAFDDTGEQLNWVALKARVATAFADGGRLVDQAFGRASGMVRCYMSGPRLIGFGEQEPRRRDDAAFAMASSKAMYGADHPPRADLRAHMEQEWTPALLRLLALTAHDLPLLWDADFLLTEAGYRLCEINVSCVSPFPEAAPQIIAATLRERLPLKI